MQIYIIYDHNINVSETTLKTYFSNIVGFLNVYLQFSEDNSFYFINNKTIIFDSTQNNNLNDILFSLHYTFRGVIINQKFEDAFMRMFVCPEP